METKYFSSSQGASTLTLPDLSLLLPTLSNRGEGFSGPLLTHEPFTLTNSNLVGCYVYVSRFLKW